MKRTFRKQLLDWYARAKRPLPWRATRDPYAIWVSEIMLQQTRVTTVLPYFDRWLRRFPTVESLAEAPEEEVLKQWSGLGYYSRARNLHRGAKQAGSVFPADHATIRKLAGVGDYTAAAIASIAFGQAHAAVDGNVLRVMARLMEDSGDIGSPVTRQRLTEAARTLLDPRYPGEFNQALMELGATVCLPKNPRCLVCPVANLCEAREHATQHELPVKLRRAAAIKIDRTLLIVRRHERILFWQRSHESRQLAGFWELPEPEHLPEASKGRCYGEFRHSITNYSYNFAVCEAFVNSPGKDLRWLRPMPVKYLFSTATKKALRLAGIRSFEDSSVEG
jgi:A/G-specific adenine glycosylase